MHSLFKLSELPEPRWIQKPLISGDTDKKAFTELAKIAGSIVKYVNDGLNLYIWSDYCGNGKTSWAIRIMFNYFDKIWHSSAFNCKAVFVSCQKFIHDSKANINYSVKGYDELCYKIKNADLVIWDDLPCANFTDFEHQLLFNYIDSRINEGKANIYTGNENFDGCTTKMGAKLTSRVFSGISIELREKDKRGWDNGTATDNK